VLLYQSLTLLLFLSLSFSLEQNFERAQFPTRSGDIIILPNNIQDDSFLVLLNSNNVEQSKEGLQIEETNVANLISSLVGGPIVNSEGFLDETVAPSAHNLFNKAKANVAIFLNSIGSDDLASLPSLKILQQNGQKLGIKRVTYPQDTIASLTTLITGHTPSAHGIVNRIWDSAQGEKTAYSAEGPIKIFNLNDQFSQTFEGRPLIVSASINFQMASALGVNPRSTFGNNFALYWDEKIKSFVNLNNGPTYGLGFNGSELLNLVGDIKITSAFDLSLLEDFSFLSEIAFLKNFAKVLSQNEYFSGLIKDKVPDLFAYSFASIKALKLKNGVDSPKFSVAMGLIDETLLQVFNTISTLYSGKVSFEVVFMGTPAYEKLAEDKELKNRLLSLLKDSVNKQTFETYFPSIYLQERSHQVSMCQRVREAIANQVICTDHTIRVPTVAELVTAVSQNFTATDYNENATTFQTVLWMSIIMLLFVIGAVSSLCYVDLGQDSILSRTTLKQHNL